MIALLAGLLLGVAVADEGALERARAAITAGDHAQAAALIVPLLDDDASSASAWARLGDVWHARGLSAAAVIAWEHALARDPSALDGSWDRALEVAAEVGDDRTFERHLHRLPDDLAEPARTRAALLGARRLIRQGRFDDALALIGPVRSDHPEFARAQDLRGIALANLGRSSEALAALLTAQAAAPPGPLRARITANLGRTYYGAGNYMKAVEHLGEVPHGSVLWPRALVEHAWARFAIEDHAGTLSVLHTLQTPYYAAWYQPEGDLLRIQAYYLLCKFTSASEAVTAFDAKYAPIKATLDAELPGLDPERAWVEASVWMEGGASRLPSALLHPLKSEDRMRDALRAVARIDAEIGTVAGHPDAWVARAEPLLRARRESIVRTEGSRLLARAAAAQVELAELLEGMPIIRLDILGEEADLYERAARTGTLDYGDRIGRLRALRATRHTRVWPTDARETWADELGYYRVDVRSDCPEASTR